MLPPETLELVCVHLARRDLVPVLAASAALHHVAARVLYRALIDVAPTRTVGLVKTLVRNDVYPALVRRLDLEWPRNILTANFLRLLHRALLRLPHLVDLGLEFSTTDNVASLAWVLHRCPFSLRVFATSMRCDAPLAHFLATQTDLVEICLRGFHPEPAHPRFPLAPTALPRLRHFRTVLASPDLTADFLRGRPVESVSMSLCPGDAASSLNALLLSTRPLRRLTVMSFDAGTPAALVAEIAARLPMLEALHAVVLVRHSTRELLLDTAPALGRFRALRYLTFMAPGALASENELEIVAAWGKACPTLKTVILPKGLVWGCVDGRWVSIQDVS